MKRKIKEYTVDVTKDDGMKSIYFVLALSAGGAEETVLREVYAAKYALAKTGWPVGVRTADLFSKGAAITAIEIAREVTK